MVQTQIRKLSVTLIIAQEDFLKFGWVMVVYKLNLRIVEGYNLYDKYPDYLLNYPIENFRVYITSDYFLSKLPILVISTSYMKAIIEYLFTILHHQMMFIL